MKLLIALGLFAMPSIVNAQTGTATCADSALFFEFQVDAPATWIADTALAAHPTPPVRNPANLVAFTIDTAGVPILASLRVLKVSDAAVIAAVRASVAAWRFRPARVRGCPVRQRVQTPVGR